MNADILISGYLDESLTPEQFAELEAWIHAAPENAQQFAAAVYLDERLQAEWSLRQFTATENKKIVTPRFRWRHWQQAAALAACLILVFTFWWQRGAAEFATVVQVLDAKSVAVGDRIAEGNLRLEAGIIRLRFDSGVEVTLEGPADFEVLSKDLTRLRSGLLMATVPPGAEGFRVDTPSAQVIDLGTAFGIQQSADGVSKVSVFDGKVEIASAKTDTKRLLSEGETIQLAADGSVSAAEFSHAPFEKMWPAASGIAGSTGAFEFAPPFPRPLRMLQSDTQIYVVPEGYSTQLQQPCPLDIAAAQSSNTPIPAGSRVRSYLLQYNPASGDPTTLRGQARRIEGSITFDRPIVGLIVESATLQATDAMFASRWGMGPGMARGLELKLPHHADVVSLSEDRRTVTLKLVVLDRLSDHVRVIVEATLPELAAR